jgi:uncharacterized RDD family membrane protein YckC
VVPVLPVSRNSDTTQEDALTRRAGFLIRAAAAALDAAIGLAATLLLSSSIGLFFARRAVVTLHIGDPHTLWKGPLPFILGAIGEVVYLMPFIFLLVWILDPLTGATLGKRVFRLRVRATDGRPASTARRWYRCALQTAGLWGFTIALLAGSWQLAAIATVAGAIVLVGSFAAAGPSSLALHDRLSGTACCHLHR